MKKNKLLKYSLLGLSLLSSSIIIATSFQNNHIRHSFLNDKKQKNEQLEMSKNIGFPIQTILKTGHDAERFNLFFFAEGYQKDQEQLFLNDIKKHIENFHSYKEFTSLFNFYAVFSHVDDSGKGFFNVTNAGPRATYYISPQGENKLSQIINIVENSFLDKGGKIADISIINFKTGRSFARFFQGAKPYNKWFNITIRNDALNRYVFSHETGHSLVGLADEYQGGGNFSTSPNLSSTNDPEKIKWKEFLGFKNIGITTLQHGLFKPSDTCLMKDSFFTYEFCEVCRYHTFLRLNEFKTKDIYIAKPSISLEHKYNEAYKELDFPDDSTKTSLSESLNKKIDFSTMVHNFRNESRKIKLKMTIKDSSKAIKKEWNQEFDIQPNELKKITILTEQMTSEYAKNEYKIYGDVIDVETDKVLDSRKSKFERDKDYKKITIKYKLFENNTKTSNNIYPKSIDIPFQVVMGSDYKLVPPTIKGFKYKEAEGDLSFKVEADAKEITLYYEKLKSKKFKVQLKDEDGYLVETREETIYENEVFKPSFYDFLFFTDSLSIHYKKAIPESDKIWKYEEINDDQMLLSYNTIEDKKSMIDAQDVYLDFGSTWDFNQYAALYTYEWYLKPKNSKDLTVSGDSVDTNKPGVYYVTFSDSSDNKRQKTIKVFVKNQNGSLPSISNDINTQLKDEKIRIENTLFYPKKWQYKSDEIKKITSENLFDYIWGLKQKSDFQYQVTSLNTADNKIQFKLKISKNGSSSETKEIETIYKLNDNLVPPNEELKRELKEEIARINALNLDFRKPSYTWEEINKLNEQNILWELKNLDTKSGFTYEFIMNEHSIGQRAWVEFDIKISKQHLSEKSKHFVVHFTLSTDPIKPPSFQLKEEKERIDKLNLQLKKSVYSQYEIVQITKSTLLDNLNNWVPKNDFSYEITYLNKLSNTILFIIKIRDSKTNETIESKSFNLSYENFVPLDNDPTLKELKNEKSRVDNLIIKLKKEKYSQEEINNLNESTLLLKELSGWFPNSNFKYFVKEFKKSSNRISFKIEINKNNQSITTKYFSLNYQLDSNPSIIPDPDKSKQDKNDDRNKDIDNINNNNNKNNNLTTILLSTLIPISIIALATTGVVIWRKKYKK